MNSFEKIYGEHYELRADQVRQSHMFKYIYQIVYGKQKVHATKQKHKPMTEMDYIDPNYEDYLYRDYTTLGDEEK